MGVTLSHHTNQRSLLSFCFIVVCFENIWVYQYGGYKYSISVQNNDIQILNAIFSMHSHIHKLISITNCLCDLPFYFGFTTRLFPVLSHLSPLTPHPAGNSYLEMREAPNAVHPKRINKKAREK